MSVPTSGSARECGDDDVVAGRGPGQRGWYEWIAERVVNQSVLDVGCGLGYGLDILKRRAASAAGQDTDKRLGRTDVRIEPLSAFSSKSVDVVTAVDVIEHVEADAAFLCELARIARSTVIVTTPNWTAGRGVWPYHIREYTPDQLRRLSASVEAARCGRAILKGTTVFPIRYEAMNDLFNRTRVFPITAPFAA